MTELKITDIRIDGGTQTRAALDRDTVNQYAEDMLAEVTFPNITVFHDGKEYWCADGFHRIAASLKAGYTTINAEIKQGTRRDAILYSVGANNTHGLRRKNVDKRRAVEVLLEDEEWGKWSDREIARRCCVSHEFVRLFRPRVSTVDASQKRNAPDGKTYPAKQRSRIDRKPIKAESITIEGEGIDPRRKIEDPDPDLLIYTELATKLLHKVDMLIEKANPITRVEVKLYEYMMENFKERIERLKT